ncbi:MAG: patatin-like phospholipase family protein [Burkholderiales bacterium]|nr:patatin-like phospholipase family protein [Burkholderiales bacterium]
MVARRCGLLALACLALAGCQTRPPALAGAPTAGAAATSTPAQPASGATAAAQAPGSATPPAAALPRTAAPKPPRIGLALGGGAARGFAHIGVIQVLEEAGIRPDLVVGTSAGSLVAALYASGKGGQELAAIALTMDEGALTDWSFPGRGVIRGEALARYVREQTGGRPIEQMKLPLGIVATDLDSGNAIVFRRGDTGTAVRASSAVPAVFQPVRIGAREYVDGGLVAPVPVRFARDMGAELVLAVDIATPPAGGATADVLDLLLQTFSIMARSVSRFELAEADVVVEPALVGVSSTDFTSRLRAIRAGREAAHRMLPALRARIAALSH